MNVRNMMLRQQLTPQQILALEAQMHCYRKEPVVAFLLAFFLGIFGVLYYLHRNKARFGGGAGQAADPVCGMQVERSSAPARATYLGVTHLFCSDGCREKFERSPERFVTSGAAQRGAPRGGTHQ